MFPAASAPLLLSFRTCNILKDSLLSSFQFMEIFAKLLFTENRPPPGRKLVEWAEAQHAAGAGPARREDVPGPS